MVLVTLFSAGGCSLADVFAWMSDNGLSSPIDITSNVHKTYFNGGDGSEGDPYQIDNALQLYYFAWLQDLGLFNVDSDDEGTQIDTVYFVLTNNIDMSGYQLPPIGTTEHPFLGNFDGQGYTVSNLTVENEREHLFEPPEGSSEISKYAEIIGFFAKLVLERLHFFQRPAYTKHLCSVLFNELFAKRSAYARRRAC